MLTIFKKGIKDTFSFAAIKWTKWYLKKDRSYTYQGLKLHIKKDVFHPGFFRSTTIMAEWLDHLDLNTKLILELGCGSGLLSLLAAKKGAQVTSIDINRKAVENAKINADKNELKITAYVSDLFSNVNSNKKFDIVLINPPYFEGDPKTEYEYAWYCGEDFNYFKNLFLQISHRPKGESYFMIVSDNCDLNRIHTLAENAGLHLQEVVRKKKWGELFFIYKITS